MTVRIMIGDVREKLRELPEQSVHCVVCSPPYWGLRDYGVDGQIGLEATPQEFIATMTDVFREVRRVLRDDGTCWVNMGDCYATGAGKVNASPGGGTQGERWKGVRGDDKLASMGPVTQPNRMPLPGLKPKDLVGMPWRLAFALQDDGWWLRQDIIWAKPNPMPESVRDRCTKSHEYIFLLSKSERYYFDQEAIAEPETMKPQNRLTPRKANPDAKVHGMPEYRQQEGGTGGGTRNKRSVWTITTKGFSEAHFATFPPELPETCIKAGCPESVCSSCGEPLDFHFREQKKVRHAKTGQAVQMVRDASDAGSTESGTQLLQQGVCVALDGQEPSNDQGIYDYQPRVSGGVSTGASGCNKGGVCPGTSPCNGSDCRAPDPEIGGCAPPQRCEVGQPSGESGDYVKGGTRPASEAEAPPNSVPPLHGIDRHVGTDCPRCGANLEAEGAVGKGVVLDCFFGAGTTGLVADRLQRDCIGIELNPAYAEMARRRIQGESPLFAEVAA